MSLRQIKRRNLMNRTSTKTVLSNAVLVWRVFKILKRVPAALTRVAGTCRCTLKQLDTNIAQQFGSGEYVAGGYPNADPINWKEEPVSTQMCLIKNGKGKKWELDRPWIEAVCCSEKPEECAAGISLLVSLQESLRSIAASRSPKTLKPEQKSKRGRSLSKRTEAVLKLIAEGHSIDDAAMMVASQSQAPNLQRRKAGIKATVQTYINRQNKKLASISSDKQGQTDSSQSKKRKSQKTKKKSASGLGRRQIQTNSKRRLSKKIKSDASR